MKLRKVLWFTLGVAAVAAGLLALKKRQRVEQDAARGRVKRSSGVPNGNTYPAQAPSIKEGHRPSGPIPPFGV